MENPQAPDTSPSGVTGGALSANGGGANDGMAAGSTSLRSFASDERLALNASEAPDSSPLQSMGGSRNPSGVGGARAVGGSSGRARGTGGSGH